VIAILHLSDLHFHAHAEDNAAAAATLSYMAAHYPEHHILVTGDITDDGQEAQYENARAALEPFRERLWLVPGNHDYGPLGNFYLQDCAERFDRHLAAPLCGVAFAEGPVPAVKTLETSSEQALLIGLNSNLRTTSPFDFACGEVGEVQRNMLQTILSHPGNNERIKIVALHHHPFYHSAFLRLLDGKELLRIVFGCADVLAFGHKHVAGLWPAGAGTPWILAADNSPGRPSVREITIGRRCVAVRDVPTGIST